MDSVPVNWDALDSLVVDFAKSDRLLFPDDPSSSPPASPCSSSASSYRSLRLIRQIRRSIEAGKVDAAIDLLRLHVPALLDERRILFWLQKQKFIELLRSGTAGDRDSAIQCLRVDLAPRALDAYPEAYEEFKHLLLVLIFDKDDQSSPVAYENCKIEVLKKRPSHVNQWSERRRLDLAGLVTSILRSHLHAYDPIFSLTLRYLISIHRMFCHRQGVSSPILDPMERLLLEGRDPHATAQDAVYETPPFDEVDVQALAHAVELTRQGAIDSLRMAKGDLLHAFQNELCRMKLDLSILDKLLHEYCIYRGIIDGVSHSPLEQENNSSRDCSSSNIECTSSKFSDGETSVDNADAEGVPESYADSTSIGEIRFACEVVDNNENCSTSDITHQETSCRRSRSGRNYATGQKRRKKWRGRVEEQEYAPCSSLMEMPTQEILHVPVGCLEDSVQEDHVSKHLFESMKHVENKYDIILETRDLTYKGMTAKVVEEIKVIDPDFFIQNPHLLFQLKQFEFLSLVNSGDHEKALMVARAHLAPLATKNEDLLKPLKETLACLLKPCEEVLTKAVPLPILATSLQVAMGWKLGIQEPQLMKIVRATLHTHNEWFKIQMCKDRFEQFLKIDQLKEIEYPLFSNPAAKPAADDTNGSSQMTICSNSKIQEDGSSSRVSPGENVCDENAILKVMEFLALPRADAIHLLMQYNGNADTVIQQIFL
ncbi:uncharacterized protein LOC122055597 isoform X2 [Zingiber officinale]|uniref:uncharacterized protein LOC122055597 isoform X2 n=1 Tax=Zingiber officinale TaxID=94328 RepID=UPI001C4B7866|nr:uncharacterized protein LOC122055597 isoform X2 [Zingiber officinale]